MNTLEQSAKELKASIDKVHKAREEFMKAYEASIEAQMEQARDSYFSDKYDYTTHQDWTQRG